MLVIEWLYSHQNKYTNVCLTFSISLHHFVNMAAILKKKVEKCTGKYWSWNELCILYNDTNYNAGSTSLKVHPIYSSLNFSIPAAILNFVL